MRKDRIEARLKALGINQFEAAERAGRHKMFLYDYLVGKKQSFKGGGPRDIAAALECSLEYLMGDVDDVGVPPGGDPAIVHDGSLALSGEIEDGSFRNAEAGKVRSAWPVGPIPNVPIAHQVAYLVRGDSYSSAGLKGGAVVKCLLAKHAGSALRSGAWVVIQRAAGDMRETTIRELQYFPDRVELRSIKGRGAVETIPIDEFEGAVEIAGVAVSVEFRCP